MTLAYPVPQQDRQSDIFVGDGGRVYGPFDFSIFDVGDVEIWTQADGEDFFSKQPSVLVLKQADLPFDLFTITFPADQPATTRIVVRSARLDSRSAGVIDGTRIDPTALEKELSKISTEMQEIRRDLERGWKSDFGLPGLKLDANVVDGDTLMKLGDRLAKGANALDIAQAQGYAAAAHQDAIDALASAVRAENAADLANNNLVPVVFTGNGVSTDVALPVNPGSKFNVFAVIDGVFQIATADASSAYELIFPAGVPTIRFAEPVPSGLFGICLCGNRIDVQTPAAESIFASMLAAADAAAIRTKINAMAIGGAVDPSQMPAGSVVQSVFATAVANASITATIPRDASLPQSGEGGLVLQANITPKSATNKIRARFVGQVAASTVAHAIAAIFHTGSADAFAAQMITCTVADYGFMIAAGDEYVAGGTSLQTISVRAGPADSTPATIRFTGTTAGTFLGGAAKTTLLIEEIKV